MTDGVDASLNFRHDGKETSTLDGSTRGLNYLRANAYV